MTVSGDSLAKVLRAELGRGGEWVVREHRRFSLGRELGSSDATREVLDHRFEVTVFHDSQKNRGEATLSIDPADDRSLAGAIRAARQRAAANQGPLWSLPRPAAPARVDLVDRRLGDEPEAVIAELGGLLGAADLAARIPRAAIEIASTDVQVLTSSGFDRSYRATAITVDATVVSGSRRLRLATPVRLRARRLGDLALAERIEAAVATLAAEAIANPVSPGVYDLIIDTAALERRAAGGFGWLAPLVAQASGLLARQALSRYQPGQSIYGDAEVSGDPLTLSSDGARPFGWRSAPFAERGEAVRRFDLVDRGVAAGLALDDREAALRETHPNGGVRNLELARGKRPLARLATGERPALIATELSWVEADSRSGDVAVELRLARAAGGEQDSGLRGGQLAGNLFEWLPRLRLGAELYQTPSYRGPRWIAIPAVRIV